MKSKVLNTICRYHMIAKNDKVVVALSGGADSVTLLAVLNSLKDELQISLVAVHINHHLRGEEADNDEIFCKKLCEEMNVLFIASSVDVNGEAFKTGEGLEECARRLRYVELHKVASDNGKIATGHTLSDNAETLIFNISRGAGLHGLCGIPPVRSNIIRPLIDCTREETESYIKAHKLSFVTDSSNLTDDYTRNNIRHHIIPKLKSLNPSFEKSVARLISSMREDDAYLNSKAREVTRLDIETLKSLPNSILKRVFFLNSPVSLDCKHIEKLVDLVGKGKGKCQLPENYFARIRKGDLEFYHLPEKLDFCIPFSSSLINTGYNIIKTERINKENFLKNNNVYKKLSNNMVDNDKISDKLIIRSKKEGDRITLADRNCSKSLKKLFNEAGIAPEKRNQLAVLADDDGVLWVEGFGVDARARADENTKNYLLITCERDTLC